MKARASWMMLRPRRTLFITAIGAPQVGKTTVLALLAELLDEDDIVISHGKNVEQRTVCLVDGISWDEWQVLAQQENFLTIKVCQREIDSKIPTPQRIANTDTFFYNDGDFRLLSSQLKDLYNSEIKNHRKWKAAFNGTKF